MFRTSCRYAAGLGHRLPVVEVELKARKDRTRLTKLYQKSYPPPADANWPREPSVLSRIEMIGSTEHGWFGWFGVSNFPGAIPDVNVMSMRFRQKNIQIGDNAVIENIAGARKDGRDTKATDRTLQRWTVGEIFITNTAVVPNARRDGFKDNAAWRQIQADVANVTETLSKLIRSSSNKRNLLNKPTKAIAKQRNELKARGSTLDETARLAVDAELSAQLEKIERAVKKGADSKEAARLIADIKGLRESIKAAAYSPANAPATPPGVSGTLPRSETELELDEDESENLVPSIVCEILIERFGQELAKDIMLAVYARLDDD